MFSSRLDGIPLLRGQVGLKSIMKTSLKKFLTALFRGNHDLQSFHLDRLE